MNSWTTLSLKLRNLKYKLITWAGLLECQSIDKGIKNITETNLVNPILD